MKERQLTISNNDDPALVVLTDEVRSNVLKTAKDLYFSVGELHERVKSNSLEKGFSQTLLTLLESYTVKLHESLDYNSTLKKEHDKRYVEIRELNMQNHELRKQLGDKVSAEDVREKLKNFKDIIYEWWVKEGFGHVSDTSFGGYGCRIKLSCNLSYGSEKEQVVYLKNKGYEINEPERNNFDLIHSEKNVALLISEVTNRFPSARLWKIDLSNWHGLHIRDAEFDIRDFGDI